MLSILVPSRNERFLTNTIKDLLLKCEGDIEIIVVLDGYWVEPVDDLRVSYIHREQALGMRAAINAAAALSKGEYLMKIDAHCMVDTGYDVKLAAECDYNTVIIPRRKRLDAEKWCLHQTRKPDVDYEFLQCPIDPSGKRVRGLSGTQWNERSIERLNSDKCLIDENMSFQGSCWFMEKRYFEFLDVMDEQKYGTISYEAQEIGLKCWLSGGRVLVNKKTWYAHLYKGKQYGRGYRLARGDFEKGEMFAKNWMSNSSHWKKQTLPLSWLIEHFSPVPTWPDNWRELFPQCTTFRS